MFEEFEQFQRFKTAWSAVRVERSVEYALFTFGDSELPYYLVTSSADKGAIVRIRRGRVTISRARIITPDSASEGLTFPAQLAFSALHTPRFVSASAPAMSPASLFTFRARLAAPREPLAASRGSLPTPRPHLAARWGGLPAPQPCLTAPSVGLATFSPRPTAPRACLAALCLSLAATRPRPAAPRGPV